MTTDAAGRVQAERVEGLLAHIQDLVATLAMAGAELEQEVARAIYRSGTAASSTTATLELENARLRRALEDRAVVEQAKGMLIAGRGCTADDAFAQLADLARRGKRSVQDVAGAVVDAGRTAGTVAELQPTP